MNVVEYSMYDSDTYVRPCYIVNITYQHPMINSKVKGDNIRIGCFNNILFDSQAYPAIYFNDNTCNICLLGRMNNDFGSFRIYKDDLCIYDRTIEDIRKGFNELNRHYREKNINELLEIKNKIQRSKINESK